MDTTSGRVKAHATITDEERTRLLAERQCFRCKQKGHISCACPQKLAESSARAQQANTEESEDTTVKATGKAKFTTQELFSAITDLNDAHNG